MKMTKTAFCFIPCVLLFGHQSVSHLQLVTIFVLSCCCIVKKCLYS